MTNIEKTLGELNRIQDPFSGFIDPKKDSSYRIRARNTKEFLGRKFREIGNLFRLGYLHERLQNQITDYEWSNRNDPVEPRYLTQARKQANSYEQFSPDPFYAGGHLAYMIRHPLNTIKSILKSIGLDFKRNYKLAMEN